MCIRDRGIAEATCVLGAETLTFTCPDDGSPLCAAGQHKVVAPFNSREYVLTLAKRQATAVPSCELGLLLNGFWEVIPQAVLIATCLSGPELAELITGNQQIEVLDWRAHTVYDGLSENSSQVEWFWAIMSEADNTFRMQVLQFCTGSGSLPICGFRMLQPQFNISKDSTAAHLPQAHVCANQLVLPTYTCIEDLRHKLTLACKHGCGFGFV
eukprot:TRINITY_DN13501_c0_g1_i2.p1 TRINITY_DN13501_c0_g1~~TRINITY_DN13501_c0_g1_i2.p1  ORF type:complete len:212 (+),score=51.28 TRINITY_DN13501_c0_g1_i2:142-777(+)